MVNYIPGFGALEFQDRRAMNNVLLFPEKHHTEILNTSLANQTWVANT